MTIDLFLFIGSVIIAVVVTAVFFAAVYCIGAALSPSKCSNCPLFLSCCQDNYPMCCTKDSEPKKAEK